MGGRASSASGWRAAAASGDGRPGPRRRDGGGRRGRRRGVRVRAGASGGQLFPECSDAWSRTGGRLGDCAVGRSGPGVAASGGPRRACRRNASAPVGLT